jgi:hypothetical protein
MRWATRDAASESRSEARVAAIDSQARRPVTDIDLWGLSVLQARGPMTLSDLVTRVADRMYRDAVRDGAACVDIGLFGAKLFHAEAAAFVARGDGKWWAIDKERQIVASAAAVAGRSSHEPVR